MRFKTKNGWSVIIPKSTMDHMEAHSVDWGIVKEAIRQISYDGGFMKIAVDMGRVIGNTTCVPVTDDDEVMMLFRKNRKGMTPYVLNRQSIPTTKVVIILREASCDGSPVLVTSWYGELAPMEPWDAIRKKVTQKEIDESEKFWKTHALIYNENEIDLERSRLYYMN